MSLYARASSWSHYLAVVTLLDQLDPKEYEWEMLSVIIQKESSPPPVQFIGLFHGIKSNREFSQIVYKFLMDRDRAGSCWVNLQTYVNLATQFLKILRDK